MCLAIVSTEDHLSTLALDDVRCEEEKEMPETDRLELTMSVRVEKEKKQESRDAWTKATDLIGWGSCSE